jgi:hypothetical protein
VSPILVRPVREQLEHDRVIRLLQAKYRRKHEVAINVGLDQTTSVDVGTGHLFPDLVLFSQDKSRRLQGTIEVETGESVNSLESMAQWVPFSRLKAPFILYVPPVALDAARRLCAAHGADPAEIWTYHVNFDQVRFTLAHRSAHAPALVEPKAAAPAKNAKSAKAAPAAAKVAAPKAKAKTAQNGKPNGKSNGKPNGKPNGKANGKAAVKAKPAPTARTGGKTAAKAKPARPAAKTAVKAKPAARTAAPKKTAAKATSARRR